MRHRIAICVFVSLLLCGCGNIANVRSFSTPYSSQPDGDTAHLRVITNGMVRGVPASACIDWRRKGAGVIAVVQSGFANRNGQSLSMPPSPQADQIHQRGFVSSEVRIPAGQDFAFNFLSMGKVIGRHIYRCANSMTFKPEVGKNYELLLIESNQCIVRLQRLDDGQDLKDSLRKTQLCNAMDAF